LGEIWRSRIFNASYFIAFLFLLCGAARLARFNIQKNPVPKNPGRPDRKYFVGLPIPAAAAMVAAVVYAVDGEPIIWMPFALAWLVLLLLLGFLMISTWRYYSFKGISLNRAYSPLIIILTGAFIYALWNYSHVMWVAMAVAYVGSGIAIRIGGIIRRRLRHTPAQPVYPPGREQQIG
jgi:CDP-diacylglycerol--serine O-phosphatidyltransferase